VPDLNETLPTPPVDPNATLARPADAPSGALAIPGYDLLPKIAEGGMGVVYRARDLTFDREVAIKVMKPGMNAAEFVREAKVTARLPHPGIPPVYAMGTLRDGRPYLAMKLIQGETQDAVLKRRTEYVTDRGKLLAAFEQMCHAVGFAHAQGIIHRDLKPSNVMVGAFGEVQVMDWGLAKHVGGTVPESEVPEATPVGTTEDVAATVAGAIKGTPAYMAPEQARGEPVDARADVFALGGISAAILTGHPPFAGNSVLDTIIRAAQAELADTFARLDASGADPDLLALCKKSLAAKADDRPANATDLAQAVAAYRAEVETRLMRQIERERDKLAVFEYGRTMQVAHQEWKDGNQAAMRALLDNTNPILRGWEWSYLNRLYDPSLLTFKGHTQEVTAASFSADGTRIVTGSVDNTAKVWDVRTGAEVLTLDGHTGYVHAASFSTDGTRIVTGSLDNTAKVWDAKTGVELLTLKGHREPTLTQPLNADDTQGLATNDLQTETELPAAEDNELAQLLDALAEDKTLAGVQATAFSPDGTQIVTGSEDETAKVWDARTGAELLTLNGHTGSVHAVSFSPDGRRIVTGSWDFTAKVWDARTGTELLTLNGHTATVCSASFSADGTRIVTGSENFGKSGQAKVWDAITGAELLTLNGHTGGVSSVAFNPEGTRIVTGSYDKTAKVWDAKSGAEVLTLNGHTCGVNAVSFSADGTRIVTGSGDNRAMVWDARPMALTVAECEAVLAKAAQENV
jgi:WD40 repeat protein